MPCCILSSKRKRDTCLQRHIILLPPQATEPDKVKLGLRLSQSRPLYEAFKQLKEQRWDELTTAQRRAVDAEIRDFVLGGVALEVRCLGCLCCTASMRGRARACLIRISVLVAAMCLSA